SPPGRCRRACRSSRARVRSPCTSRTIRSNTPNFTARSPRASTAPAASRSGTAGRTSCSRRSATGSSRSGSTASGCAGRGRSGPLVYYTFDLLELDGEPLVDLPLAERKARLEKLLDKRNRTVRLSESFDDGEALYRAAQEQGLEGIMAKRADSRYQQGKRTRD